jgi:hypothetical protein
MVCENYLLPPALCLLPFPRDPFTTQIDSLYLSEIVAKGADSLYFTKQEIEDKMLNLRSSLATQNDVRSIIISHWSTWLSLIFTFIAAVAGVIAVVISMQPKSENNNSNTSHLERPIPSPTRTQK